MTRTAELRSAILARNALLARRKHLATLAAGLRAEEDELHAGRRSDQLDRASDLEKEGVLETLQAVENRELGEVDAALERLARGTYGGCERCSQPIGQLRLRAVPEARLCMVCAARP